MKRHLTFLIAMLFLAATAFSQEKELVFLIKTNYGDMKVKLYNDTPGHRDNFLKLVNEKYFNGSTFHRVIAAFMIQGGGKNGGAEDVGYTIPAEITANHFHKKGALAAARTPDNVNPEKASSGSQFYIAQGKVYTKEELDQFAQRTGQVYSAEQREAYTTVGGTPHLDGSYTVFGEVIEGLDVIDKIAAVATGGANKPKEDVTMTIEQVK